MMNYLSHLPERNINNFAATASGTIIGFAESISPVGIAFRGLLGSCISDSSRIAQTVTSAIAFTSLQLIAEHFLSPYVSPMASRTISILAVGSLLSLLLNKRIIKDAVFFSALASTAPFFSFFIKNNSLVIGMASEVTWGFSFGSGFAILLDTTFHNIQRFFKKFLFINVPLQVSALAALHFHQNYNPYLHIGVIAIAFIVGLMNNFKQRLRGLDSELGAENSELREQIQALQKERDDLFARTKMHTLAAAISQLFEDDIVFQKLTCLISLNHTLSPVIDPTDEKTIYEEDEILHWLTSNTSSPTTRAPLTEDALIRLPKVRALIASRLEFYKKLIEDHQNTLLDGDAVREAVEELRRLCPKLSGLLDPILPNEPQPLQL